MKFRSVVLDVDSTLCAIEGIDWLAARRGADIAKQIAALTDRAMNGEIPIEAVYGERLRLIRPTRAEVDELAAEYRRTLLVGAREAVAAMQRAGVRVVLVSGGLRPAIAPLAADLGAELHAVDIQFDSHGSYAGFDSGSPLAAQSGKFDIVRSLGLQRPTLAVGDGATDVAMRAVVDRFVAFTGVVRREAVVAQADAAVTSFAELKELALGEGT